MRLTDTITAQPIQVEQTLRHDRQRILTSAKAGKVIPLMYAPIFREDRVSAGSASIRIEMMETAELLMNAIEVNVQTWLVPYLAFERFNGSMDVLNASYSGTSIGTGQSLVPFINSIGGTPGDGILPNVMGLHSNGANQNRAITEAYNCIINHRRKARSRKLEQRVETDRSLAPAFWNHTHFANIVPDFDQAAIDGEVPIQFDATSLPVMGMGTLDYPPVAGQPIRQADGSTSTPAFLAEEAHDRLVTDATGFPQLFAELEGAGVRLSLSNLEAVKRTAAFAQLRDRYSGIEEDHIIDLLMQGIRVPEEALRQPVLLDRKRSIIGYNRRYATDAANLAKSATNGESFIDVRFRTPQINTGGIIMVTCEILPEQLWERQKDYFLYMTDPEEFPNFTRDFLDPEKVDVIKNDHVDVAHSDPDATFGYMPLNKKWDRDMVRVGGKYYRPEVDPTFDEDRQKIWAIETPDPTLTEDFYLATNFHQKVFADTEADAFEFTVRSDIAIVGNTVFGKKLMEDDGHYDHLLGEVDFTRIDQSDAPTAEE